MSAVRARGPQPGCRRALFTAACAALWLASCAPPPRPGSLESLEALARRGSERREHRLSAFEARGALRVDGRATGRLPAVNLHLRGAQPDRLRLQAGWLLGTLGDAAVRADTLTVWIPGERLGFELPALADTLGVREPARFVLRALVAGWVAPHAAWREAVLDSDGVRLAWEERGEQWTLALDRTGRPREARVALEGHAVRARYEGWHGGNIDGWPARIELADEAGLVRLRLDLDDLHAVKRARASWFALRLPDDAQRPGLEDLKRILTVARGLK